MSLVYADEVARNRAPATERGCSFVSQVSVGKTLGDSSVIAMLPIYRLTQ